MIKVFSSERMNHIRERFFRLYGPSTGQRSFERLAMLVGRYGVGLNGFTPPRGWDERDTLLITYADMVTTPDEPPLATLNRFLREQLEGAIETVHILPFYPYSSDDGFSVVDYRKVKPDYGSWSDVENLREKFSLMFDLVLNHVSRQSPWFRYYVSGAAPYRHYFMEAGEGTDLSQVVRPRNHPLLLRTQTRNGERFVWNTFSDDQIDVDFRNPDVLFEFLDIIFLYVSHGARILRLDAIAYLWKEIGTSCIHLPQTHELVKLIRDVLSMVAPHVMVLTETNVPHSENISYFGRGDEAHMVYQFTLPPLLLHALQTGSAQHLSAWAAGLQDPPPGCTFLNFTASHDGIGVRPLEGILPGVAIDAMIERVRARQGQVSTKINPDGSESAYELNITYFDALSDPDEDSAALHEARFLCSQAVPLAFKGIPAIYFNSLLGARNNLGGVEFTGLARTINREKWDWDRVGSMLAAKDTTPGRLFREYTRMLRARRGCAAFHPDGSQKVLSIDDRVFALLRESPDGEQQVLALFNFSREQVSLPMSPVLPPTAQATTWRDLLSGRMRGRADFTVRLTPYEVVWLVVQGARS